mgnify:CR=1 FL=1
MNNWKFSNKIQQPTKNYNYMKYDQTYKRSKLSFSNIIFNISVFTMLFVFLDYIISNFNYNCIF